MKYEDKVLWNCKALKAYRKRAVYVWEMDLTITILLIYRYINIYLYTSYVYKNQTTFQKSIWSFQEANSGSTDITPPFLRHICPVASPHDSSLPNCNVDRIRAREELTHFRMITKKMLCTNGQIAVQVQRCLKQFIYLLIYFLHRNHSVL